jgi:mevalonate kinase
MLMGEHAVLHGYPAIVGAINRRIYVTLTPRSDNKINIIAENFGKFTTTINFLQDFPVGAQRAVPGHGNAVPLQDKKFNYVLAAITQLRSNLISGFDLHITSDFSDQLGLGSSAAVTVAVLAVIQKWLATKLDLDKLYKLGINAVHAVQNGLGSGADVAASIYGGIIVYQAEPLRIEPIDVIPEITLVYTGYKTPTVEVIKQVNQAASTASEYFDNLYKIIGDTVESGIKCLIQQDWQQLGQLFLIHQNALRSLGVSDAIIDGIIEKLKNIPTIYGAKISGAGLGDCVIALGRITKNEMKLINVKIDRQGVV